MNDEYIKAQIKEKVSECIEKINSKKPSFPMLNPRVEFNLEGLTLGTADYRNWTVDFNLKFARLHLEDFLNQTVPHEIAHLADYQYYKKWGHGPTWKQIMRFVFNLEPKRCSNLELPPDVKRNKMNTFIYICICPGKEFKIGMRKHNIILKGRNFICNRCRTRIQCREFIGKV